MKTGPFAEHSNQLWNISAVPSWSKVNQGLIRMYKAEVSGGRPAPSVPGLLLPAPPPPLHCFAPLTLEASEPPSVGCLSGKRWTEAHSAPRRGAGVGVARPCPGWRRSLPP